MKSGHVYKSINTKVSPILKRLGFKKLPGTRPRWICIKDSYAFHFYLKTDKYPWEPFRGCHIEVQFYVCNKDIPLEEVEFPENGHKFFLKDSDELRIVQERVRLVADKIKNVDLVKLANDPNFWCNDIEALTLLHSDPMNYLDHMTKTKVIETWFNTQLHYLDDDDINFWGDFLVENIEKNINRIFSDVILT